MEASMPRIMGSSPMGRSFFLTKHGDYFALKIGTHCGTLGDAEHALNKSGCAGTVIAFTGTIFGAVSVPVGAISIESSLVTGR
jgi:hypothetical protein